MKFSKRKSPDAAESHAEVSHAQSVAPAAVDDQQHVTMLAVVLGVVASIGGFMFGYVRYEYTHHTTLYRSANPPQRSNLGLLRHGGLRPAVRRGRA